MSEVIDEKEWREEYGEGAGGGSVVAETPVKPRRDALINKSPRVLGVQKGEESEKNGGKVALIKNIVRVRALPLNISP